MDNEPRPLDEAAYLQLETQTLSELDGQAWQDAWLRLQQLAPEKLRDARESYALAQAEEARSQERLHDERAQTLRHALRGARMVASASMLELALTLHDQRRKDGSPYSAHVVAVASRVYGLRTQLGEALADVACAVAIGHDLIEDVPGARARIERALQLTPSEPRAQVLRGCELISKFSADQPGSALSETAYFALMRAELQAGTPTGLAVIIAKACDQIHNLATCGPWAPEKRLRYCDRNQGRTLPLLREARRIAPSLYDPLVTLSEDLRTVIAAVRLPAPGERPSMTPGAQAAPGNT